MKKLNIRVLLLMLTLSVSSWSNNKYDYHTDTLTYGQYRRAEWNALCKSVKAANKNGIEFYYLQLRGGFAAFYTKRYFHAVDLFYGAEKYGATDQVVKNIHYLSALYSGRTLSVQKTYKALSDSLKNRYPNPAPKILKSIAFEAGLISNADSKTQLSATIHGGDEIYGQQIVPERAELGSFSATHQLLSNLSLHQSFQYLNYTKTQQFYAIDYAIGETINPEYRATTEQQMYHANFTYNLSDILFFNAGFNALNFLNNFYEPTYLNDRSYEFNKGQYNKWQYLYSTSVKGRVNRLFIELSGTYYKGEVFENWQGGAGVMYYPIRGSNLYCEAKAYWLRDDKDGERYVGQFALGNNWRKLWLKAHYTYGGMQKLTLNNGLVVFNTAENPVSRLGIDIAYPLYKNKLWITGYYQQLEYKTGLSYYSLDTNTMSKENISYTNHLIFGGLTWHF